MGYRQNARLINIIACLCFAVFFIHFKSSSENPNPKEPLNRVFADVDEWKGIEDVVLETEIVDSLGLDDYLFRNYRNGLDMVSLYIGYYRTTGKIGAAHSPLVCFPGQGWEVSTPRQATMKTTAGDINVEELVAQIGTHRELLLYWFQSYDMTSRGTFYQKIKSFWARVNSKPEDNAFVRVSVPIRDGNTVESYQKAVNFIQRFYPEFHAYITQIKDA